MDFTFIFVSHPEHALYLSQKITKLYIVMRLFYAVKFKNRDITTWKLDKKRKNAHGPMGLKHCEKYRRSCISNFIKLGDGHYVIYGVWNLSCVTNVKV